MLASVSVVVILTAIIAATAIARAVLVGDGQPATSDEPAGTAGADPESEPILVPAVDVRDEGLAGEPALTDPRLPWWERLRSVALLVLMVAALGAVAAALLAAILVGGVSFIDKALA